jgi:hypothetical protein
MIKTLNKLCGAIVENLHDALPVLLIAIFYQMTILELPMQDIAEMVGWVVFVSFGMIMIL